MGSSAPTSGWSRRISKISAAARRRQNFLCGAAAVDSLAGPYRRPADHQVTERLHRAAAPLEAIDGLQQTISRGRPRGGLVRPEHLDHDSSFDMQ
jgi:hypothetical protein